MKNIIIKMHGLKNLRSQKVGRIIYLNIGNVQEKEQEVQEHWEMKGMAAIGRGAQW